MKKEVISVLDGKTERESSLGEKIGVSLFLAVALPILLLVIFITLFIILLTVNNSCQVFYKLPLALASGLINEG
ncbi:MAG: hypothetical protein ACR2F2_02305, partial [Pyrinomonadaceae bacterium]